MILELPQALQRPLKNSVTLQNFEGPLDLLLYLIERKELAIEEVALVEITKPYLLAIRELQGVGRVNHVLDGEFFVIAATLVFIKSRCLLPPDRIAPVEEVLEDAGQDPTWSLIEQLVQYKKIKDKAKGLADSMLDEQSKVTRSFLEHKADKNCKSEAHFLAPVSPRRLKDLWSKMQLRLQQKKLFDHFGEEFITVSEQMDWLLGQLSFNSRIIFQNLWERGCIDQPIFSTFLAALELTRQQKTTMHQAAIFDHLWIGLFEK